MQSHSYKSDFDHLSKSDTPPSIPNVRRGGMQPEYHFLYNDLKADIAEIQATLTQLSNMYATHVLPSFGEKDTTVLQHDIRIKALRLTEMLQAAQRKVNAIVKLDARERRTEQLSEEEEQGQSFERQIRNNMQKRFAAPLQQLSLNFRRKQTAYLDKLKQIQQAAPATSVAPPHTMITLEDDSDVVTDSVFSETQMLTVENANVLTQERNQELNRVASNVNDLATLVKDMASLVVNQGTVLDRIDYNLEQVDETTFSAVHELRIADRYQRKRHALCCIIILAVGCAIMFSILVFKWT